MIVSKTKGHTLFAISIFLLLVMVSFLLVFDSLLRSEELSILKLVLAVGIGVIFFIVFTRFGRTMQTVRIGQEKIEIRQWISRRNETFHLKDVVAWTEDVVKTKSGDYREVKILFPEKKSIRLSNKEHTQYKELVTYLGKKLARKRVNVKNGQ